LNVSLFNRNFDEPWEIKIPKIISSTKKLECLQGDTSLAEEMQAKTVGNVEAFADRQFL
jgi:hypothetical protein